jgi:hypothetical protein
MKPINFMAISEFSIQLMADVPEAFSHPSEAKAITNRISRKALQAIYIPLDGLGFG